MRVMIDESVYELRQGPADLLPQRAALLGVLQEAAQRSIPLSLASLTAQFGFKSVLPLNSRLKALSEAGLIEAVLRWKQCPVCAFSPKARRQCECCEGTGRIAIAPHANCEACGQPVPIGDRLCGEHGGDVIGP